MSQESISTFEALIIPNNDFGIKNYRPFNRGNKLKRVFEQPDSASEKPSILPITVIDDQYDFSTIGRKRALLKRVLERKELKDDLTSTRHLIEDDPYLDIQIEDAWGMPDTVDQVKTIESMVHTLRNRSLRGLTNIAMEIIDEEASFFRLMSQLEDFLEIPDTATYDDAPEIEDKTASQGNLRNPLLPMGLNDDFSNDALLDDLRSNVQKTVVYSSEFVSQFTRMRSKVVSVYLKKKQLAKVLAPFD